MKQLLGLDINSIENFFMGFALFFLSLYLLTLLIQNKPHWFFSKNLRECLSMEKKFDKLVNSRRDVLHHYYWAKSQGDDRKMRDMNKDLARIDLNIQTLREEYHTKKSTLTRIVQNLM